MTIGMQDLLDRAQAIGAQLKERKETVSVAESSTGGLISAALLSVAGASAYYVGGAVVYTIASRKAFLPPAADDFGKGKRGLNEDWANFFAASTQQQLGTTWAVGEIGASGPTGSRYGDPAGMSCIAVAGPNSTSRTIQTGSDDRVGNMYAFAAAALDLLAEQLAR
ncbi:CinA family protein [Zavarzinia sp. CC-PAN008]|uniref:CinA family protein n=1 Tax=Zavarzinia sp. CC-PAN008 TaxID=3243332 RepID=UPI003F743EA4